MNEEERLADLERSVQKLSANIQTLHEWLADLSIQVNRLTEQVDYYGRAYAAEQATPQPWWKRLARR